MTESKVVYIKYYRHALYRFMLGHKVVPFHHLSVN